MATLTIDITASAPLIQAYISHSDRLRSNICSYELIPHLVKVKPEDIDVDNKIVNDSQLYTDSSTQSNLIPISSVDDINNYNNNSGVNNYIAISLDSSFPVGSRTTYFVNDSGIVSQSQVCS